MAARQVALETYLFNWLSRRVAADRGLAKALFDYLACIEGLWAISSLLLHHIFGLSKA
jgi:hypothetical protein